MCFPTSLMLQLTLARQLVCRSYLLQLYLDINQACLELFTKKGRGVDQIPQTKDALVQRVKRAVYQGRHCWGQALEVTTNMPPPTDWVKWTQAIGKHCGQLGGIANAKNLLKVHSFVSVWSRL